MIKIENYEVIGWEHVIRGMRNPMNSWEKSDSRFNLDCDRIDCNECPVCGTENCCSELKKRNYAIGPNDHKLMMQLRNAGTDHRKFMRMMNAYVDITAPLYWWKEFDTYKVGTVANSCSTMHKIADKEFTLDDFSTEHLFGPDDMNEWSTRYDPDKDEALSAIDVVGHRCYYTPQGYMQMTCNILNSYRDKYLKTKNKPMEDESERAKLMKKYWWQMIQLLPSSYNQKRTVMFNYEVLANIYKSRKNHKLDEWRVFCEWIEQLPYSELITGETTERSKE